MSGEETGPPTFDVSREELRHWAHTIHQIDDTLDLSLIEGRAKQLLFQALNSETLTSFVGTGVSAAYGRMSWQNWNNVQLGVTENLAAAFMDLAEKAIEQIAARVNNLGGEDVPLDAKERKVWRWLKHRGQVIGYARHEVGRLKLAFERSTSPDGRFPGGESLPIKFEIAQKLHDLVLSHRHLFLPVKDEASEEGDTKTKIWGTRVDPKSNAPFEALKKALLTAQSKEGGATEEKLAEPLAAVFKAYADLANRPEGQMSFETLAKVLLVDECAHAERILINGIQGGAKNGRDSLYLEQVETIRRKLDVISESNLRRDVAGIRQNPTRFDVLQYFRLESFKKLVVRAKRTDVTAPVKVAAGVSLAVKCSANCPEFPNNWIELLNDIGSDIDEVQNNARERRVFLTPTSRFLVEMVLALSRQPIELLDELVENGSTGEVDTIPRSDFTSRQSIMSSYFDPLHSTVRKLNINRYLTTNYDFEIERFYQDQGYRRIEHDPEAHSKPKKEWHEQFDRQDYRVDGSGGALRDLTFSADTASDLITFSVGHDKLNAAVFHLHGRATVEDPLVVTERNYMDMYLRNDPRRDMVDEGITMAFSSTPLLFLGLGMDEADVLRPLRQFISDKDRSMGYTAMVLLPANGSIDARSKFASSLYLRYGAHTIFFGGGEIKVEGYEGLCPVDWLHRVTSLIKSLTDHAEKQREALLAEYQDDNGHNIIDETIAELRKRKPDCEYQRVNPERLLSGKDGLKSRVGSRSDDLKQDGMPELECTLSVLYGKEDVTLADIVEHNCKLKSCHFTPIRPGKTEGARAARKLHTPTSVNGEPYTQFYLNILSGLVRITLKDQNEEQKVRVQLRDLSARIVALDGLYGALLTASFCASLSGLEKEWRAWLKDWQKSPPHRKPILEEMDYKTAQPKNEWLPEVFVRHRVENAITDLGVANKVIEEEIVTRSDAGKYCTQKGYQLTHIRAFDTFIEVVASQTVAILRPLEGPVNKKGFPIEVEHCAGRRFYTVASRTGMGKGTFFSVFTTPLGLSSYLKAAHPEVDQSVEKNKVFVGAIFLNFSFSTELGSVYDMLQNAMLDLVAWLAATREILDGDDKSIRDEVEMLKASTGAALRSHLTNRSKATKLGKVCANRASAIRESFLHRQRGVSRQTQMRNTFLEFKKASAMFSNVDSLSGNVFTPRVLICLSACELLYSKSGRVKNMEIEQSLRYLTSKEASAIPMDIVAIGADNILGPPWTVSDVDALSDKPRSRQFSLKHIVIKRDPISSRGTEVIENRIERSKIAFYKPSSTRRESIKSSEADFVYFSRLMDPIRLMVDNFSPLACALFGNWRLERGINCGVDAGAFADLQREYFEHVANTWETVDIPKADGKLYELRQDRNSSIIGKFKASFGAFIAEQIEASKPEERAAWNKLASNSETDQKTILFKRYSIKTAATDENDWRDIRTALSGNRYSLTILLAAAQEIVLNERDWKIGAKKAESFIFKTVDKVRSVSEQESEAIVLQAVLDTYRLYHRIGCPWRDVELHDHLLRNIAVINSPVSANVIVRLPAIRAYFDSLGEVTDSNISRRRSVAAALIYLGERGLLFRLSPHYNLVKTAKDNDWPKEEEHRYGLHRMVQRYYISKLGSRTFEPVKTNDFAPSRYASLPSDVPRLNHEALRFLRSMLVGLSQYPDVPQMDRSSPVWLFASAHKETKIQALRAALTMIRSVFSIAVVSRFEDYKTFPGERDSRARGYFETYKVRLRWIIRKAWELHAKDSNETNTINALYRDEIVWLYNEVGISCLVQGNLTEAVTYLRQALFLNREIEGHEESGAQSSIISLNLAITQIERGRIDKARERLETILRKEDEIRSDVFYLCTGYLGLVAHLMGRKTYAEDLLEQAIEFFLKQGDLRALAIFRGHLGRLLPDRDPIAAEKMLQIGLENAEAGGHEDIRHRILIAQVRLSQFVKSSDKTGQNHAILDEAEEYARNMGTPALACDAAHDRARILIAAGDSATAGRKLVRAMAIARRNQMNLRLNSMLTTYAQVLWMRGQIIPARRLCYASIEMAKHANYALEIDRALQTLRRWAGEI